MLAGIFQNSNQGDILILTSVSVWLYANRALRTLIVGQLCCVLIYPEEDWKLPVKKTQRQQACITVLLCAVYDIVSQLWQGVFFFYCVREGGGGDSAKAFLCEIEGYMFVAKKKKKKGTNTRYKSLEGRLLLGWGGGDSAKLLLCEIEGYMFIAKKKKKKRNNH